MPLIWKDKNYIDRYMESSKSYIAVLLPLIVTNIIIWYIFVGDTVNFKDILLISFVLGLTIYALVNIYFQFPNGNIPKDYHPYIKTSIYIFQFFIACFVSYIILTRVIFVT